MSNDLYEALGVAKDADASEIKKSYRKLALKFHPDRNAGDANAEARFKEISAAFEVLGDPEKRKLYDEFGLEGLRAGFDPEAARAYNTYRAGGGTRGFTGAYSAGGRDFRDMFNDFNWDVDDSFNFRSSPFGGGARGYTSGRRPRNGRDITATMTLDFDTAILGGEQIFTHQGREHRINIPSGARDGDVLRIKGKGEPAPVNAPGAVPGDLRLHLSVAPHPEVERDGLDLIRHVTITMPDAILGTELKVETPQGSVIVTVKSGTASGTTLRIPKRGVKRGSSIGNYLIKIDIIPPDVIDDSIRAAAEQLRAGYTTS